MIEIMHISVIIPAKNEEKNIGRCIESLICLETNYDFDVTVVDNCSEDDTCEVVKSYHDKCTIYLLKNVTGNVSSLRNTGASMSHGNVLFFIDADCTAPPLWFEKGVAYVDNKNIGAVGCSCNVPESASWVRSRSFSWAQA